MTSEPPHDSRILFDPRRIMALRLCSEASCSCRFATVLHRDRQPARAPGGLHLAAQWGVGDTTGAAGRVEVHCAREPIRFLIRDHDRKFSGSFDAVFQTQGTRIIRTPIQVPEANGIAERFVGTVRSECLDRLLIVNRRHLERTLTVFVDHYNSHRPHRSLGLVPLAGRHSCVTAPPDSAARVVNRRDRLGGLLHEYRGAAGNRFCAPYTQWPHDLAHRRRPQDVVATSATCARLNSIPGREAASGSPGATSSSRPGPRTRRKRSRNDLAGRARQRVGSLRRC
jgi:Integrase core domain